MSWLIEAKTKKGSYVKASHICNWEKSAKTSFAELQRKFPECNITVYKLLNVTPEFEGGIK